MIDVPTPDTIDAWTDETVVFVARLFETVLLGSPQILRIHFVWASRMGCDSPVAVLPEDVEEVVIPRPLLKLLAVWLLTNPTMSVKFYRQLEKAVDHIPYLLLGRNDDVMTCPVYFCSSLIFPLYIQDSIHRIVSSFDTFTHQIIDDDEALFPYLPKATSYCELLHSVGSIYGNIKFETVAREATATSAATAAQIVIYDSAFWTASGGQSFISGITGENTALKITMNNSKTPSGRLMEFEVLRNSGEFCVPPTRWFENEYGVVIIEMQMVDGTFDQILCRDTSDKEKHQVVERLLEFIAFLHSRDRRVNEFPTGQTDLALDNLAFINCLDGGRILLVCFSHYTLS